MLDHLNNKKSVFLKDGFRNWKHALTKDRGFHEHQNSECHKTALKKLYETQKDIGEVLSQSHASDKERNRKHLRKVMSSIRFLARQNIPFRNKDDEKSNFKQLLYLRAEDDPDLYKWIEKKYDKHISHHGQKEILEIMALKLLRGIASDIREADFFSIMADESSDVTNKEQLTLCIRWVDENLAIHEDYIGRRQ